MHDPRFDDLLLLASAGELDRADREELEMHRRGCPECARLSADIALGVRAAGLAAASLPRGSEEALERRLRAGGESPDAVPAFEALAWRGLLARSLVPAAAVLVVGLCVLPRRPLGDAGWSVQGEALLREEAEQAYGELESLEEIARAEAVEAEPGSEEAAFLAQIDFSEG